MKLIRLKLGDRFRSLAEGFEIHFLRDFDLGNEFIFNPYCLAGLNGSGKSNTLEALAAIFYNIECKLLDFLPESFEFAKNINPVTSEIAEDKENVASNKSAPDAYELEYFFPLKSTSFSLKKDIDKNQAIAHIKVIKLNGQSPTFEWIDRERYQGDANTNLARNEIKELVPKYVLGYSSGHNEILSLPFFKMRFVHYDEYCEKLTRELDYSGRPEGRLVYLDDQFSQAILLCHFLFPSEAVTKIFQEKIGLKSIERFRIIIKRFHKLSKKLDQLDIEIEENIELTSKFDGHFTASLDEAGNETEVLNYGLMDKLIACATSQFEDDSRYADGESYDLILDYLVNDATRAAFQYHFGEVAGSEELSKAASALNLFQSLQILMTLNQYKVSDEIKSELYLSDSLYVSETIPMPASDERIFRFKDFEIKKDGVGAQIFGKALSDGEHQLIHTIGLCLLYRHEPALFLLDEPETHLNPEWRASYISTLRAALEADQGTKEIMREVLLTSHSPFVISDCKKENVLVFEKDENGTVKWSRPEFNTFGASSNAITIKIFNRRETIGDFSNAALDEFKNRLKNGEDSDQLIDEANSILGDSLEKVLFVNQALDKKEGRK